MRDFSIKKLYYSISEVSKITGVEQYVLRYWESEIDELNPQKNRAGNRAYTNKDIQTIMFIKSLLREKKYTIEGAKKILKEQIDEMPTVQDITNLPGSHQQGIPEEPKVISVKKEKESIQIPAIEYARNISISAKDFLELRNVLVQILRNL